MHPTNLTLEERERWAYASGDTALAAVLAEMQDEIAEAHHDGYVEGYEDCVEGYEDCVNGVPV